MPFERFTAVGRAYTPVVSITKGGMISFNKGAVQRFGLHGYCYAILFFDKESQTVGVMPTDDEEEDGICRLRHRQSGADISAKSFLEYFAVAYASGAKKYDAEWDEERAMVVFVVK